MYEDADAPMEDVEAPNPNEMDEKDVVAAIEAFEQESFGFATGDLAAKRAYALERYKGDPLGNEVDGRSAVVDTGLRDTVEWIMPQALRVFLSGDDCVKFEPVGPNDSKQAEHETRYINQVILEKNDAFNIFSTWFRDALIAKVGYVRASWRERTDVIEEKYRGLTEDALTMILGDPEVEITSARSYPSPDAQPQPPMPQPGMQQPGAPMPPPEMGPPMGPDPMQPPAPPRPGMLYDVTARVTKARGYVHIDNVAPEEVRVHKSVRGISLQDACFVQFRTQKTISELRQDGYDIADVVSDEGYTGEGNDEIRQARDRFGDDQVSSGNDIEPASKIVWFKETYCLLDVDGDGIAERRKICQVGDDILSNDYADLVCMAAVTPIVFPHKHIGVGYDDLCNMPSLVKTAQMRALLDNLALANNGRLAGDPAMVAMDDVLNSRPGGFIRTKGPPSQALMPITHPVTGEVTLRGIEWADSWRESSTGVSAYYQGLNADALNKTASGIAQIMTASQGRVEAVIRSFATGVKELFEIVHALTLKNATAAESAKINGEWVTIDPREWRKRTSMTITVGLGTGTRESRIMQLMQLAQLQAQGLQAGIVKPVNLYATGKRITEEMGYRNADEFWTDPSKQEPQQPQKPPEVQAAEVASMGLIEQEKLRQAGNEKKATIEAHVDLEKAQLASDDARHKALVDAAVKLMIEGQRGQLEQAAMVLDHQAKVHQEVMQKQETLTGEFQKGATDLSGLMTAVERLAQKLNAPKVIVRDQHGRAQGVVSRDDGD